jgi:hypothetical protein
LILAEILELGKFTHAPILAEIRQKNVGYKSAKK